VSENFPTLHQRAQRLLRTEIDFVPNPEFAAEALQPRHWLDDLVDDIPAAAPADLPAHLRRLCQTDLLSPEQESALFREMNLLKFQASALRARLDPAWPTEEQVVAIETRLARAQTIRDHILRANMRLVMSIVKKFVTPQQSFDEMLSDGTMTLMQAVEKFDYDRGFRFSTYAYRSIARSAYRTLTTARQQEARFARDGAEWAFEQPDRQSAPLTDPAWSSVRERMTSMLEKLDRREQFIIRGRYALGAHRKVRTFQYLADKLGVSKERARQLEQRAVGKLRAMAARFERDELRGAGIA
jgi:RNA polymerase sigma factor (sigma-70 family)